MNGIITEEIVSAAVLNRIFGFKPKIGIALINEYGSASRIFNLDREELDLVLGPFVKYKNKINKEALESEYDELVRLEKEGAFFLPITDPLYPQSLRDCDDPPIGLYIKSISPINEVFGETDFISIVGTRNITSYGTQWGYEIVRALCSESNNVSIVSGLALGVDALAHKAALDHSSPTIAVLPTGIDLIYPRLHNHLSDRILDQEKSALVSDYPPGTYALTINFLRRNRIIAALSRATILIESKARGGGLLTARLAHTYNRDVYALPGKADDICSQGCNNLIREKIAEPITSIDTFMASIGLGLKEYIPRKKKLTQIESKLKEIYAPESYDLMILIIHKVAEKRDLSIDELREMLGRNYIEISTTVRLLEAEGLIVVDVFHRCSISNSIYSV